MGVVLIAFLVIGLAMPVLPLHVHQGLGLGTFIVGVVAGSQFAAALVSRMWAGRHADIRGAKHAVIVGLITSAAAGLLYLLSLDFVSTPTVSVTILVLVSAGTQPGERVHPEVQQVMREEGFDLSGITPRRLTDELAAGSTLLVTMGCGDVWMLGDAALERIREAS
jgi:MFS family permease